jgi:hypothetical protein
MPLFLLGERYIIAAEENLLCARLKYNLWFSMYNRESCDISAQTLVSFMNEGRQS